MNTERKGVDVLAELDRAQIDIDYLAPRYGSNVDPSDLREARAAVAELIDAARDVNYWLCRTGREGTAHQMHLASVIAKCGASA